MTDMAETTTLTLVDFLLTRIAEDEAMVHEIAMRRPGLHVAAVPLPEWPLHRVLAECEAKRRIVAEHEVQVTMRGQVEGLPHLSCETCEPCPPMEDPSPGACLTLRLLALPFADHPDYGKEWRP